MEQNSYYFLFANCIPVRGYTRAIICDLTRKTIDFIPIQLFNILIESKKNKIKDIVQRYKGDEKEIMSEYFDFLLENEYIYLCDKDTLKKFPPLSKSWQSPNHISSLIIEYSENFCIPEIIRNIEEYGKLEIQIRFFTKTPINTILKLLSELSNRRICSLELIIPFSNEIQDKTLEKICLDYQFISKFIFYNTPKENIKDHSTPSIIYTHQNILSESHCGFISPHYFNISIDSFTESLYYNNCLNQKLCINKDGEIKNCLNMDRSYGSIHKANLEKIIFSKEFNLYNKIKKDSIDVCKECEFRYICSDCRTFIKYPENIYSQPAKCTYNPYIAKWEDEEGYVSVEECGTYSKNKGFVVDVKKVEALNLELWGG
ncbi:MAG: grasp-with-spasm system SPASM domain peptide maturase [Bacteroidales bacterium]|nr:grasp-with-spasm system SPASM domain peptide maturase [Bacteroidales bacterium]